MDDPVEKKESVLDRKETGPKKIEKPPRGWKAPGAVVCFLLVVLVAGMVGTDNVAHGGGDGFGRQAVVTQHLVGGAGVTELVLHTQTADVAASR